MGSRLVLADAEWIVSDSSMDDIAALMEAGRLLPATRTGKRVLVNPAHVVSVEDWPSAAPAAPSES